MAVKKRNYKKEYKDYHSKPKQIKNRTSRGKARSIIKKLRGAKAIAGKDIDHKNGNPRDNRLKNLRVRSIKLNRGKKQ
jgi:hypothetical protein|tara:strand:- start:182 stop:415 length:234 start_codon:yes stop_codon:yes gene_type:complete